MKTFSARILSVFLLVSFLLPATASAASLYIDPPRSSLNRGDAMTMAIRLDTDEQAGECINAVDGVLEYSANIHPVDVIIGDSIFSIWVEQPTIDQEKRQITFAGGIPNGYCGRVDGDPRLTNVIAEIVFRSPGFTIGGGGDESLARVQFNDVSTAYLNDGQGTKAPLTTYGAQVELSQRPGAEIIDPWQERVEADNQPPEEFSISLQKDDRAFAGEYYIVFNTTDKQTGIDHYEVMEEPLAQASAFRWGRADAPWVKARSPYVLQDQTLNSTIRVRAVDKAGNVYVATQVPDESQRTAPKGAIIFYGFIAFLCLVILLVVLTFIGWYRKRRRQNNNEITEKTEAAITSEASEVLEDYEDEDSEYDNEKL